MRWRIVPLMAVFVALAHFNRVSISVVGTEKLIREDFISEIEMGRVYSAYLLLYTLFMMPGGWFTDRFGPRRAWMLSAFSAAVFVACTGVAGLLFSEALPLLAALILVRSLLGIASAPLHPTGARLVGNWIPSTGANLANGIIVCSACIGMTLTYVGFGWLMDLLGWPGAFLVSGGITLAVALLWTRFSADYPPDMMPERHIDSSAGLIEQFKELLTNRSLLCLTFAYAALGYFQYLFFYWAQYYFEKVQEVAKDTSRLYSSIMVLAMGVGMVLGGWVSDWALARYGSRRGLAVAPILGFLLAATGVVLALRADSTLDVLIFLTAAMCMGGMVEGSSWTAAVLIGKASGGKAAGIMNTGGNAGGLLAPLLTPYIADWFGWPSVLKAASAVCVLGAVLWLAVTPEVPGPHSLRSPPDR